jgi:hypothetical protein
MIAGRLYGEFFRPEGAVSGEGKGLRSYAER